MRSKTRKTEQLYSVDILMRKTASSLVSDFRDIVGDEEYCRGLDQMFLIGPAPLIRDMLPAPKIEDNPYRFKMDYQLQSVVKRYRFSNDTYSDSELEERAIATFLDVQSRLAALDLKCVSAKTDRILDLASNYVAKTLGTYCDATHRNLCRFGRRASVGVPARMACEAERWELPMTGSQEQISWFDSEMSQDECVQNYWTARYGTSPNRLTYQEVSSLKLTLVPKTYKAFRAIMPNTTIGSYMSFGLGEMIRIALKRRGYNIKTLQERHRYLAKEGSRHNNLTTLDLSSASDSITDALVKRLFPPDWYDVLSRSRIAEVVLPNGQNVESLTFCTMGIGYTFPLQTLIFLSLLKATEHVVYHKRARRTISVYGDDMIFPSRMYEAVLSLFSEIGFMVNVEKTFSDGPFRESCGGDYFRGVDVRPFQPESGVSHVDRKVYEAVLYKFINGLLTRWTEYEIGKTLSTLVSEFVAIGVKPKLVPYDYPDASGIRCPSRRFYDFLEPVCCCNPVSIGHGLYRFPYLGFKPNYRKEERHEPYYWLRLRGLDNCGYHYDSSPRVRVVRSNTLALIELKCNVTEGVSPLIIKEVKPVNYRPKHRGRRLRRTDTFVTIPLSGRIVRQSGISGFRDP